MKPQKQKPLYLVKISGGGYDDYFEKPLFATYDKKKAQAYCKRLNSIVKAYLKFYRKFEYKEEGVVWIKDEYRDFVYRWMTLREFDKCYFDKIEIR